MTDAPPVHGLPVPPGLLLDLHEYPVADVPPAAGP